MRYLIKTTETYRVDSESQVEAILEEAKIKLIVVCIFWNYI